MYQVCECTTVEPAAAAAITRPAERVVRAGLAPSSAGSGRCTNALSRGAPIQCTSTSHSVRSCATSSVTWTPAPPYTSGGYSRVIIATRVIATTVVGGSDGRCLWLFTQAAHRRPATGCSAGRFCRLPIG
ncbi:Uncharacterised protein [Mycobacteroides abscessus subsp. abscessus]|nr:Uncharacterised protein [Mycobacteroides abscessus subsp. abscessus]